MLSYKLRWNLSNSSRGTDSLCKALHLGPCQAESRGFSLLVQEAWGDFSAVFPAYHLIAQCRLQAGTHTPTDAKRKHPFCSIAAVRRNTEKRIKRHNRLLSQHLFWRCHLIQQETQLHWLRALQLHNSSLKTWCSSCFNPLHTLQNPHVLTARGIYSISDAHNIHTYILWYYLENFYREKGIWRVAHLSHRLCPGTRWWSGNHSPLCGKKAWMSKSKDNKR